MKWVTGSVYTILSKADALAQEIASMIPSRGLRCLRLPHCRDTCAGGGVDLIRGYFFREHGLYILSDI